MEDFVTFLLEARLNTYASAEPATGVPALLPGAQQFEYAQGEWLYRDSYFGSHFFAGQETIYRRAQPAWSMVYAGGVLPALNPQALDITEAAVYAFLGAALRRITPQRPFRGPRQWQDCAWIYENEVQGALERFSGREMISFQGQQVYELHYSGGMLS
jgi:hypothetical protein